MKAHKPDLKLFRQFVGGADLYLLKKMSRIINERVAELTDGLVRHLPLTESQIAYGISNRSIAYTHIISEDWSYLFDSFDNVDAQYYVYFHIDPKSKQIVYQSQDGSLVTHSPFYVGMGKGDRVYSMMRSKMHVARIKELMSFGFQKTDIMRIYKDGLTEASAREIESKLILFFGIKTAVLGTDKKKSSRMLSGRPASLLNNQYETFPEKYEQYAYAGIGFN